MVWNSRFQGFEHHIFELTYPDRAVQYWRHRQKPEVGKIGPLRDLFPLAQLLASFHRQYRKGDLQHTYIQKPKWSELRQLFIDLGLR